VPTIRRFNNCKISIYADDHMPAHFHIEDRGFRVLVEIETMAVRAGDARRTHEAMAWAREKSRAAALRMGSAQSASLSMGQDAPNIRAVRPDKDRRLVITWRGGMESLLDLSDHIAEYVIFAPLRTDAALFRDAAVGEWGWCVHWSNDMEISADTLWRLALDQGAAWLRAWRAEHQMTQAEAAKALGVSPRMWRCYEAGSHLLPKTVRLAGIGLDAQARAA
jgi:hypothetical protein